jgi:hypothetical protein
MRASGLVGQPQRFDPNSFARGPTRACILQSGMSALYPRNCPRLDPGVRQA